ncbi:MAG: Glu-tRNA(Gln) amidotransferase subunit GatE [Methanolinea sp.]|nr:Glu-tRNA(Gln) amidotransferase subunit GatE [Methanolinea sp.]
MASEELELTAGIEIHQQLNTGEKLFCHCPPVLRPFDQHNGEFFRYLRATESELGEIDQAAEEEMKNLRRFCYYTYDTTCLVESDEEPPAPMNQEALAVCLQIAKMCRMTPVPQVHTMRKLVIDGSNTSGFQRTALVAVNGTLPNGVTIETLCLEEEAAQRVEGDTFSLDRLGIPLVEITTAPCMRTPEEVQEVARYLGMVLRSTGKVRRGLGTIRQDINISIPGGARVEIKGVQELDLIAEVVKREVKRQKRLLEIRDRLKERGALVDELVRDVTGTFSGTKSQILGKAPLILAIVLRGFAGLVGEEIQPGRRLGSELSDYARKCGLGGIFHTDELPAYGISPEEVDALRHVTGATAGDCVVLVAGPRKKAECASRQVIRRARMALDGVPKETRRMEEGGNTSYMRPLPGAARMYPETDVLPVSITGSLWETVEIPELLEDKAARFSREMGLDASLADQIAFSEHLPLFEKAVGRGISPLLAARTLLATLKEISREGLEIRTLLEGDHRGQGLGEPPVLGVLDAVRRGQIAKEAIPEVFRKIIGGMDVPSAVHSMASSITESDLVAIAERLVGERIDFVREKGPKALGPLMGPMMKEVGGKIDGKKVSAVLKEAIERALLDGKEVS